MKLPCLWQKVVTAWCQTWSLVGNLRLSALTHLYLSTLILCSINCNFIISRISETQHQTYTYTKNKGVTIAIKCIRDLQISSCITVLKAINSTSLKTSIVVSLITTVCSSKFSALEMCLNRQMTLMTLWALILSVSLSTRRHLKPTNTHSSTSTLTLKVGT